jgi:hypothetical protein
MELSRKLKDQLYMCYDYPWGKGKEPVEMEVQVQGAVYCHGHSEMIAEGKGLHSLASRSFSHPDYTPVQLFWVWSSTLVLVDILWVHRLSGKGAHMVYK